MYRFESEDVPPLPMRLKIEMNSRERFSVFGLEKIPFSVASRWFDGACEIPTYTLDELSSTKLRALYQRKKGRDLFDIATALDSAAVNPERIVLAFTKYMEHGGVQVTRAMFEKNIAAKVRDPQFSADLEPLLAHSYRWDMDEAARKVGAGLVALLPGVPWKGEE